VSERKQLFAVHGNKRKRVTALTQDQKRQVIYLFDHYGDPDAVVERAGILGLQRGDVLTVALIDLRRQLQPGGGGASLYAMPLGRTA
jgi:uncharacterized protein RhaS with RHS repeats